MARHLVRGSCECNNGPHPQTYRAVKKACEKKKKTIANTVDGCLPPEETQPPPTARARATSEPVLEQLAKCKLKPGDVRAVCPSMGRCAMRFPEKNCISAAVTAGLESRERDKSPQLVRANSCNWCRGYSTALSAPEPPQVPCSLSEVPPNFLSVGPLVGSQLSGRFLR